MASTVLCSKALVLGRWAAAPASSVRNSIGDAQRQSARVPMSHHHLKARYATNSFLSGRAIDQRSVQKRECGSRRRQTIEAKGNAIVDTVVATGKAGLNTVTSLVPASVPRPIARTGVVVVGGLLVVSLVRSIISLAITLVVVGGLAYAAFLYAKKSDGGSSSEGGDKDDALSEAKRIMDKYK